MSSAVFECEICSNGFDTVSHKPLSLHCGHTFCGECVRRLSAPTGIACPTCNNFTDTEPDRLSIIYALIPAEINAKSNTAQSNQLHRCQSHESDLQFFCMDCEDLTCWKSCKASHHNHRVEYMADVANNDSESETRKELLDKVLSPPDMYTSHLLTLEEILALIQELVQSRDNFKALKKLLEARQSSAEEGLEIKESLDSYSSEERIKKLTKVVYQWKISKVPYEHKLAHTRSVLDKLFVKHSELMELVTGCCDGSSNVHTTFGAAEESELLTDNTEWEVNSNDDVRKALASVRADRRPSSLYVQSGPEEPIKKLPEVLNILGAVCLNGIEIYDWNSFFGYSRGNLKTFIEKNGQKVTAFEGSFNDTSAVARVMRKPGVKLGIGISASDDIHQFPQCGADILCVGFNGSLVIKREINGKPQNWAPRDLCFTDLRSEDLASVTPLLNEYFGMRSSWNGLFLCLHRPQLSEDEMRALLQQCKDNLKIICINSPLGADARERLDALAQAKSLTLEWISW